MAEPTAVEVSEKDAIIYHEAYQRCEAEIRAVRDDELEVRNVEAQKALTITLQGMPAVKEMRPKLQAIFTNFDSKRLDRLTDYAMAYVHTSTVDRASEPQASAAEALLQEGVKLCNAMGADLNSAEQRGT